MDVAGACSGMLVYSFVCICMLYSVDTWEKLPHVLFHSECYLPFAAYCHHCVKGPWLALNTVVVVCIMVEFYKKKSNAALHLN
jgi:hypothetical protein